MTPILDGSDDGTAVEEGFPTNYGSNPTEEELKDLAPQYPTEWHMFDVLMEIEVRQLSDDTYELRSPTHYITLDKEGFDLYRDDTLAGQAIFHDWCKRNNVVSYERTAVESSEVHLDGS